MKCPVCVERGEKSTVTPRGSRRTLMGFTPGHYDEEGKWVKHRDPNITTDGYTCSNNHFFEYERREGESPLLVASGDIGAAGNRG